MRGHPAFRTVMRIVLSVCTPLWLLLSTLYVAATPAFIRYEYGKPGFPPSPVYGAVERLSLAESTLHYLRSGETADYLARLESGGQVVYNPREVKHLVDVKVLMSAAFWVHGTCGLLCCLALALSWRPSEALAGGLLAISWGCLSWLGLMVAIGLFAYTDFGFFFAEFHHLLFEGDTWLFSPGDTLIQLFPVRFWIDATGLIALLTASSCAIVGAVAYVVHRRLREIR